MSAIAFGLSLLVVSSALGDGAHNQMIRYGVANQAGHVVIQKKGYQKEGKVELAIKDAKTLRDRLESLVPADTEIVARVFFQGLLTSPRGATGIAMVGVEPSVEARVGNLDEKIVEGRYLQDSDKKGIVIGKALAETLSVKLGDKLVLMTQRDGEIENVLFRVVGIFVTGMDELDGFYAHAPIQKVQEALGMEGAVSQLSLHLTDARKVDELSENLRQALKADLNQIEILPWQEALPELYEYVVIDDGGLYVLILIIAIVVCFGILNTVLMSVLERTKELGVMLSLGMTPFQVGSLILTESMMLGFFSILLGAGLGALMSWPLVINGIDLGALSGGMEGSLSAGGVPLEMKAYGDLSLYKVIVFSGVTFGLTLIAAIYPTWKAARLHPVEAMRHHG